LINRREEHSYPLVAVLMPSLILLALATLVALWPHAVPKAEAVGDLDIIDIDHVGGTTFEASGSWQPRGNQCWGPGNEFHYLIEIYDDPDGLLPVNGDLLATVDPAPCNGDYTDPVDSSDRGTGGAWPAPGQGGNRFSLDPGIHHICAVLRHVSATGNDIAAQTCFDEGIGVFVVRKDFQPNNGGSVSVSLSCTGSDVSPGSSSASENSPATFGVGSATGSSTCTATERDVPTGYTDDGSCTAAVSEGQCTIVNAAVNTTSPPPSPTSASRSPQPSPSAQPSATSSPTPMASPTYSPTNAPAMPPAAPVETPEVGGPVRIRPPNTGDAGLPLP
jgi:hypothetical protein